MRKLSADIIFPVNTLPVTDSVLLTEDDGKIIGVFPKAEFEPSTIQQFSGALVPGFVNAHCHLELSHLKNKFPEKTGLPEFLMQVTKQRETSAAEINGAMQAADKEMINNGIVAVGDISNKADSFEVKANSNIYYHTFIELIAFDPERANQVMKDGEVLLSKARSFGIHASLAPHATYSVSADLIQRISNHCCDNGKPTSIHMLESNDENEFYMQATGLFRKLYREINVDIKHFHPTGKNALESLLPFFNQEVNTLLIHNTIATSWDVEWAEDLHPNLFWCFCPKANLFIEDRLPDVPMLMQHAQYICIGTDSLASNHGLSVLTEMQTIQHKFPEVKSVDLIRWATLYGAKALGIEDQFGSFEKGKRPGVNVLEGIDNARMALGHSKIRPVL
jgi:aminodeoxyfutalosine deaminase